MLVKRGDVQILEIIKDDDERLNTKKIEKSLQKTKNITQDGNKTDSTVEMEKE